MNLADFIDSNLSPILAEWENETATHLTHGQERPGGAALRSETVLTTMAVVARLRSRRTDEQQAGPVEWLAGEPADGLSVRVREHASNRLELGFTLKQLIREFQALRASVVRQWIAQSSESDPCTVSEVERFNRVLDEALEQSISWYVESQQEARELLLGMLAHDLRNPLSAARNSAAYILRSGGLHAAQVKAIGCIASSTKRMHHLVEDLLDFSRTQLGRGLPVAPVKADLGDVCRQVVDELAASNPDRVLRFEASGPLDGQWDLPRIGQMVSNLAANAVQFGRPESPVTVTAQGGQDAVLVHVHNHGPAINPFLQRRLFDPYRRPIQSSLPERDGASGLHLGLYIASHIAVAHGGSIAVDSGTLAGTRFTVKLPRLVAQPAAQYRQEEPAP
jgi:signal transduction histidine kinase